jgi:hypothetical protein
MPEGMAFSGRDFIRALRRRRGDRAYKEWLKKYKVKDSENPEHHYNYRKAFEAKVTPVKWKDLPKEQREEDLREIREGRRPAIGPEDYMWPDLGKTKGHPIPTKRRRIIESFKKG